MTNFPTYLAIDELCIRSSAAGGPAAGDDCSKGSSDAPGGLTGQPDQPNDSRADRQAEKEAFPPLEDF